jgi:hypothetical protein
MKRVRNSVIVASSVLLLVAGAFWAMSTTQATTVQLPGSGTITICNVDFRQDKDVTFPDLGTFHTIGLSDSPELVVKAGPSFISNGFLKTVPLAILSNGGHAFGEGIGETRFWLDANRPAPSFIAENSPGTDFPATQVMRFNFFFTAEAFPGKVFRSVGPAAMRSTNVQSFPPPAGTVYKLVAPVDLEDVANPGVVVGRVVANRAEVS